MAFIRPMSLSSLQLDRLGLVTQQNQKEGKYDIVDTCDKFSAQQEGYMKLEEVHNKEMKVESHPGLSVPRVRLVPPLLLTVNMGSVLGSAGLSPSLR